MFFRILGGINRVGKNPMENVTSESYILHSHKQATATVLELQLH